MDQRNVVKKLETLHELVKNKRKVLISTHNNPDPDTIASGYAMRHLLAAWGVNSVLVYGGMIGRPENKAMINRLHIPIRSIQTVNPFNFKVIALVDAQPSSGNVPIPASLTPSIVVDHHPARKRSVLRQVPYVDIQPEYGSTSTIMTEYLKVQGVEIGRRLATALYYGIKADTRDLGRDAGEIDIQMSGMLYPKVLVKSLSMVENPRLPAEYFRILQKALGLTTWFPGRGVLLTDLGVVMDPDMLAVVADFLVRMEGAVWVLTIAERQQEIFFSVRTASQRQVSADTLVRSMIKGIEGGSAGGHDAIAGGKVVVPSGQTAEELGGRLKERFLRKVQCDSAKGVPLV
jgi:nanoRNase/pAp phosphatase (c-di-AMP/oligoRNAs hydrolase)